MTHPPRFGPHDPLPARVRQVALALRGASETVAHGRPWFRTRTRTGSAVHGGTVRTPGGHEQHPHAVLLRLGEADRAALEQEGRLFHPAHLGPRGWSGLDLDGRTDGDEVAEPVAQSYRLTAPARLVAVLGAREPGPSGSERRT